MNGDETMTKNRLMLDDDGSNIFWNLSEDIARDVSDVGVW